MVYFLLICCQTVKATYFHHFVRVSKIMAWSMAIHGASLPYFQEIVHSAKQTILYNDQNYSKIL